MKGVWQPPEFRFAQKYSIDRVSGCWLWQGRINEHGYPTFNAAPEVKVYAHRWVWTYLNGPIPDRLEVDHLCGHPTCVNPRHLEPVTRAERQARVVGRRETCANGHEWTAVNTYHPPGDPRQRKCRQCVREWQRRRAAPPPVA